MNMNEYFSFTEIAKDTRSFFVKKYRNIEDNEEVSYYSLSDNRPESLYDLVYSLHEDELPNDWVYQSIVDLLDYIIDYDVDELSDLEDVMGEIIDNMVQLSNYELLSYYLDYPSRLYDIDNAIDEIGRPDNTIESLRLGIYHRLSNMLYPIGQYIEDIYQDQF